MNLVLEKSDGWVKMEIEKIIIKQESNEFKFPPQILREDLTSTSAPKDYSIVPEYLNSRTKID